MFIYNKITLRVDIFAADYVPESVHVSCTEQTKTYYGMKWAVGAKVAAGGLRPLQASPRGQGAQPLEIFSILDHLNLCKIPFLAPNVNLLQYISFITAHFCFITAQIGYNYGLKLGMIQ